MRSVMKIQLFNRTGRRKLPTNTVCGHTLVIFVCNFKRLGGRGTVAS